MPWSNSPVIALALVLAACGGADGYEAAPRITLAPDTARQDRRAAELEPVPPVPMPPPVVAAQRALPVDAPAATGPRGISGEAHDDGVGYVELIDPRGGAAPIGGTHPSLPQGSYIEVTALDTGRTIVAIVVGQSQRPGLFGLTPDAARQLGVADGAAVRIRAVMPSAQDQIALRAGQSAAARLDAPPALLTALRRQLGGRSAKPSTVSDAPRIERPELAASSRGPARRGTLVVQVAALSSRASAQSLAAQLGGRVSPFGRLFRVQLGPFADAASAQRARDGAARRGYADARIIKSE